jgi:hypothetical protein
MIGVGKFIFFLATCVISFDIIWWRIALIFLISVLTNANVTFKYLSLPVSEFSVHDIESAFYVAGTKIGNCTHSYV